MNRQTANGTINVKLLVAPLLIAAVIGVSLMFARQVHIDARSKKALEAGLAAVEEKNWPEAVKHLRRYLIVNPKDVQTLRVYADACLEIRPLGTAQMAGAISAYNKVVEANDLDHAVVGCPVGLLGGSGQALGPEVLDGLFEITVDLDQGLLAVHHSCAGALTKGLHVCCFDSHISPLLI